MRVIVGSPQLGALPGVAAATLHRPVTHPARRSRAKVIVAALATLAALAAVAFASATIYSSHFNRRAGARALDGPATDACHMKWRRQQKEIKVEVRDGPRGCEYTLPVHAVDDLPDHDLRVTGKLLRGTPTAIRDTAYIGVMVRAGGGDFYELRVFPKTDAYSLRRMPDAPGFPANGTNSAIGRVGKDNLIRLQVFGSRVRALVNGTELEDIIDPAPAEVGGRRLRLVVGNTGNTNNDTVAALDDVKVIVPD
jgi:hypothetical protein